MTFNNAKMPSLGMKDCAWVAGGAAAVSIGLTSLVVGSHLSSGRGDVAARTWWMTGALAGVSGGIVGGIGLCAGFRSGYEQGLDRASAMLNAPSQSVPLNSLQYPYEEDSYEQQDQAPSPPSAQPSVPIAGVGDEFSSRRSSRRANIPDFSVG
jgi:hypothetical protein